jgi:hypothetical protein
MSAMQSGALTKQTDRAHFAREAQDGPIPA